MARRADIKTREDLQPILYLNLRPFFSGGLLLILLAAPFMRGLFFQPELLQTHMFTAVVFVLACYDQVLRREINFPRLPLDYAVAALMAAYALSLITAVHMRPAIGELLKVINYFMIYWIAIRAIRKEEDLDRLLAVCYAAAAGVAAIGLAAAAGRLTFPGAFDNGIIMSTMQYKNSLAIYLTIMSIVGLTLSVKSSGPLPKILYALGNFLLLVAILGTQSRGGWILYPLGFAALFAGLPGPYRWRAAYHLIIFTGCGLAAARLFLPRALAGDGQLALVYLAVLAAATIILQYGYHRLGEWLGREHVQDGTRRAVGLGGLTFLGFMAAFYLFYASTALPSTLSAVLPSHVASRAETISTGNTTLPARFEMTRDALRMAADHPLTGAGGGAWNALYHNYQSSLYWTTEVHNYFAQTLVEAGAVGLLAVIAIWGLFILLVAGLWRRTGRAGGTWMSIWAAAVAALTLGIHSALDFDLSYAMLGILLWVLLAAVRAGASLAGERSQPSGGAGPGMKKLALAALAATLGGALLFVPAQSLYSAGKYGAMGARAMQDKDFNTAEGYYLEACRRDPFTASYNGDLAQIYAVRAISRDDAASHFKALAYAKKAAEAEPYNTRVRPAMVNLYLMLKEFDLAVQESEGVLRSNTLLPANYEALGRTAVSAARYYLERGDYGRAKKHLERAAALPALMKEKSDGIKAESGRYLKGDPLPSTPFVNLSAGQAHYLAGELAEAGQLFEPLIKNKDVGAEALLWLAATLEKQGAGAQARALLEVLARQGTAYEKQYEELLALPKNMKKI